MPVANGSLSAVLQRCPHYDRLLSLCERQEFFLVGGAIRDALLGLPLTDLDLISPKDPTEIARTFARQIGGHWFWLDRERRQSRVVVDRAGDGLYFDFALFRAPDLHGDLLDRDFTINAMALPLRGMCDTELVDPCHGLDDLQEGVLRMIGPESLFNDPLRIVKGLRHATTLGLEIEAATMQSMRSAVTGLARIAPERIRQEIWKTLAAEHAGRGLRLLGESGAGRQLFGAEFDSPGTEPGLLIAACRSRWRELAAGQPVVNSWLADEVEQGLSREVLLLWALLLSSFSPHLPGQIAEQWRISRRAQADVALIASLDSKMLDEFTSIAHSQRSFAWWAHRQGIEAKLLLLTLAVAGSPQIACDPAIVSSWIPLIDGLDEQRPADLVDGLWLRGELQLKDGPEMTRALQSLRNAEIAGLVGNQDEAHEFLRGLYQNND